MPEKCGVSRCRRSRVPGYRLCRDHLGERVNYADAVAYRETFGKYGVAAPMMDAYLRAATRAGRDWEKRHAH